MINIVFSDSSNMMMLKRYLRPESLKYTFRETLWTATRFTQLSKLNPQTFETFIS